MATHELHLEDGVLSFENDIQWIESDLPESDPNWQGADSNGHEHRAMKSDTGRVAYPTLKQVTGEPYWCPDCGDEHADMWLECPICGEKVTPGTRPSTPKMISTGSRYLWNGEPISVERANEIIERQYRIELEARRLTARPPIGRRVHLAVDPHTAVTVVATAESEPEDRVTIMHDGTGRMETLPLEQLLRAV
jgi:DNA-directed RNA polymerase subunit RPC12/RpoP